MNSNNRHLLYQCEYRSLGCPFSCEKASRLRGHQIHCMYRPSSHSRHTENTSLPPFQTHKRQKILSNPHSSTALAVVDNVADFETVGDYAARENRLTEIATSFKNEEARVLNQSSEESIEENPLLSSLMITLCNITRKAGKSQVNDLISLLRHPDFHLDMVLDNIESVSDCQAYIDDKFTTQFQQKGFTRVDRSNDEVGFDYSFYHKDPVAVLQEQIAVASAETCQFSPVTEKVGTSKIRSGPMSSDLAHNAVPAIKKEIECANAPIFWKTLERDGIESFVGLGQVYSDKSATTLKARGFSFYPLHLILLNLSTPLRRSLITSGKTIIAYLPVKFYDQDEEKNNSRKRDDIFKQAKLKAVRDTVEFVMSTLAAVAKTGFESKDEKGVPRLCHFAIGSYCCDIPEGKDMLSLLNNWNVNAACVRCLVPSENMSGTDHAPPRTYQHTLQVLDTSAYEKRQSEDLAKAGEGRKSIEMRDRALDKLKEVSLVGDLPVLHTFPFMNLIPTLDIYSIFTFEPMHNLPLGVSKTVKLAITDRLKDSNLSSTTLRYKTNQKPKSFPDIRSVVLNGANEIMRKIQSDSSARNLRVDFSTAQKGIRFNGFFNEDGIVGMVEAKEMKHLDMVFPIIASFIDRSCGEVSTCPTTKVATMYSDIILTVFQRDGRKGWSEPQLVSLNQLIVNFKTLARDTYGPYQSSGMGTIKFHLLDHIVSDLRRFGTVDVMDAGLFEYSHTLFKQKYHATSKRHGTAMEEVIQEDHRDEVYAAEKEKLKSPSVKRKRRNLRQGPQITRDGPCCSIADILQAIKDSENGTQLDLSTASESCQTAAGIVQDIGVTETRVLVKLIKRWWQQKHRENPPHNEPVIRRVTSVFVAGGFTPEATHYDGTGIQYNPPHRLVEKRVISARNFCSNKILRQDCVLLKASQEQPLKHVRVGKVLLALRIKVGSTSYGKVFVRHFVPIPSEDEVDRQMRCLKLKWGAISARNQLYPSLTLESVEQVCDSVHVVTTDYHIHGVQDEPSWPEKRFYVNRFYYDPDARDVPPLGDSNIDSEDH